MNTEQEWIGRTDEGEDGGAAERYQYFMKPEPFEDLGPIQIIQDDFLGRPMKTRTMSIGMVRNAKDENKKQVLVFLEPFPHIRIDTAKPLQGWYKGLHEGPGVRPRPCFSEAILTESFGGFCAVGCSFSLPAGEQIGTEYGSRAIESIQVGDLVWGRTTQDRRLVKVLGTTRHVKAAGYVIIELSDGRRLRMTADHPVYSVGRGWVAAEQLKFWEELEDVSLPRLWRAEGKQASEALSPVLAETKQYHSETSAEVVSRLWKGIEPEKSDSLRRLQPKGQIGKREARRRKASRLESKAEVSDYSLEDESTRFVYSGGNVQACERPKVAGMAVGPSRESQARNIGLSSIQETSLYRPQRQNLSDEINLGSIDGQIPRRQRLRLGLRTICDSPTGRLCLSSRFYSQSSKSDSRGKGLYAGKQQGEDSTSPSYGPSGIGLGSEGIRAAGNPHVTKILFVTGAVEVFDIETESGNFYQNGVLVHNCYINSGMRGYRGTGLITVPMNYGEQVKKQLSKMYRAAAGYFSSFTDPFTPLEAFYHNTEEAAREFVNVGLPIFFLSRLRYPQWAIDLIVQNPHSYAQKSINTCDAEDWRHLSPGALPLKQHFSDIARLKKAGIYISIQVNPILPGVTSHEQIERLFRQLKEAGADHVIVKFVEAGYSWADAMVARTIKRFGKVRGEAFAKLFTENIGGQRTITEDYRLPAHERYSAAAKCLGLGYATCYEYRYQRDSEGNIVDKTGVSIGREFTTSSQCHGQMVPVYKRDSLDERFKPVEECPPSGCLYCASENEGKPRCGDELMGQATAMRMADYKTPLKSSNLLQIQ